MTLPAAFAPLAGLRRFVTYAVYPHPDRPGKTIKRPTDVRTGYHCDSNQPEHQYTYAEAAATGRPVGFVFNEADGLWFLDIDGCLINGEWSPLAKELIATFAGAAVEVSHSGSGLHIIGWGKAPPHSCKNIILGLEFYTHERFVALTFKEASGNVWTDHTAAVEATVTRYFPHNPHGEIAGWTDTPVDEYGGPTDDAELLTIMLKSGKKGTAAAFNPNHVLFEDLWTANAEALARKWPSASGGYDASEADASLASHLAYWTGKNCERMRELMFQSELVRAKWEERAEYLETTIMKVCSVVTNVAQAKKPTPPPTAEIITAAGMEVRAGTGYMGYDMQLSYFGGCVYVVADNKVWTPGTGDLLDKSRFDIVFGGYSFAFDAENKKPSDSAWDAFTRSQIFAAPRVDRTCFRPIHAAGAVIVEEGRKLVNTYIPLNTPRLAGDAGPFLRHMEKMIPQKRDRDILYHYMAACLQHLGFKAQWWPVIQGAEGNGKTLIERAMAYCIGHRYSHLVNPEAMAKTGNQFNDWVTGNLWLGIEEIYVGANRRDFLETFKSTVTNDRIGTEGKGAKQQVGDNFLNGMMFTNHMDAVPVTVDSRRYAIIYTKQQTADDIIADGMGGSYFPDLYDWFYGRNKYAEFGPMYGARIINDWLHSYVLSDELNPARLCVRAPETSSTQAALRNSLGKAEQEILEAIESGEPGFAGGWVSSVMVDRLLDRIRASVPRTKRRGLMQTLGYDLHPALIDGRVNNPVNPEGAKSRLYVKHGHVAHGLTDAANIAKAYENAQASRTAAANFPPQEVKK